MANLSDFFPAWVIDSNLRADISFVFLLDDHHFSAAGQHLLHLLARKIAFVIERNDQMGGPHLGDNRLHCIESLGSRVEGAATLTAVDSLASGSINRRFVPQYERLPNMIVAKVAVLVIWRVNIDRIGFKA